MDAASRLFAFLSRVRIRNSLMGGPFSFLPVLLARGAPVVLLGRGVVFLGGGGLFLLVRVESCRIEIL